MLHFRCADFLHTSHPTAAVKLVNVERLQISDGRNEEARAGLKYKSSLVLLLCGFVFTRAPAAPATGVCGLQH